MEENKIRSIKIPARMKRSIKTSKHNNSTQALRDQQMAYNEAIKSINQSKKVYKKYARKFNIANAANIIELV